MTFLRVLACLTAALPCLCMAARVDAVDPWSALQHARAERLGHAAAFRGGSDNIIQDLLSTPASPYSELNPAPAFINDVDWPDALQALGGMSMDEALHTLQWDLGLTRARPGVDVTPAPGFRDPLVSVSARKADVDPDIFWHALDLAGNEYSTRGAMYAVALQILRAQLAAHPPERWRELGLDGDVYTRVMRVQRLAQARPYDLRYLSMLVRQRLVHWRPGGAASTGQRALPVAYRIARVAAAYRDLQGYQNGGPCLRDGQPRPGVAGMATPEDDRPLCFAGATDRAVFSWYRTEHDNQARGRLPNQHQHHGMRNFLTFAGAIFALIDGVGLLEGAEALFADEVAVMEGPVELGAEGDAASMPVFRLTCRPTE